MCFTFTCLHGLEARATSCYKDESHPKFRVIRRIKQESFRDLAAKQISGCFLLSLWQQYNPAALPEMDWIHSLL